MITADFINLLSRDARIKTQIFPECSLSWVGIPHYPVYSGSEYPIYIPTRGAHEFTLDKPKLYRPYVIKNISHENLNANGLQIETQEIDIPDAPESSPPVFSLSEYSSSHDSSPSITTPDPIDTDASIEITFDDIRFDYLLYLTNIVPVNLSWDIRLPPTPNIERLTPIHITKPTMTPPNINSPIIIVDNIINGTEYHPEFVDNLIPQFGYEYNNLIFTSVMNAMRAVDLDAYMNMYKNKLMLNTVDSMLVAEETEFSKHRMNKNILLLDLATETAILKQKVTNDVAYLKTILQRNRAVASMYATYNNRLARVIAQVLNMKIDSNRNAIESARKMAQLYVYGSNINTKMLDLFFYYKQLIVALINLSVLNIERDRLVIEMKNSLVELEATKEADKINYELYNLSKSKYDNARSKLEALLARYEAIKSKVEAMYNSIDAMNMGLSANASEAEISHKVATLTTDLEYQTNTNRLLDKFISAYMGLLHEYYDLLQTHRLNYVRKETASIKSDAEIDLYTNLTKDKVNKLYEGYEDFLNSMRIFINNHIDASVKIARANITSTVIEAYR